MARLSKAAGRASKAKARTASHAKVRKTAKTAPNHKRSRNAGRETEVARLKRELKEALERQTATAEILRVIASSPSDVQPVFDEIAKSAKRLFDGHATAVTRVVGDMIHLAAFTAVGEATDELLKNLYPVPLSSAVGIH